MRHRIAIDSFHPQDAPRISYLTREATGTAYPAPFLAAVAQTQGQRLRVARETGTGQAVGVALAGRAPGGQDLFLLAVDPQLRGKGVRRALLESIEEALARDGEMGLAVHVPLEDRETARFLEREGFRVLDVEPARGPNQEDVLVLGKRFDKRLHDLL